jgi:hypothetical protein
MPIADDDIPDNYEGEGDVGEEDLRDEADIDLDEGAADGGAADSGLWHADYFEPAVYGGEEGFRCLLCKTTLGAGVKKGFVSKDKGGSTGNRIRHLKSHKIYKPDTLPAGSSSAAPRAPPAGDRSRPDWA